MHFGIRMTFSWKQMRLKVQNADHYTMEPPANESQRRQKEAFSELLLSDKKQNLLRNEGCHESPLLGKFYGHEKEKVGTEMGLQTLLN